MGPRRFSLVSMTAYDVESPQKLSGGPLLTHRSSRYTQDEDPALLSDAGGDDSTLAKSSRQRSVMLKLMIVVMGL